MVWLACHRKTRGRSRRVTNITTTTVSETKFGLRLRKAEVRSSPRLSAWLALGQQLPQMSATIRVEPAELRFPVTVGAATVQKLRVHAVGPSATFKIKTTAPKRYSVRPNVGIAWSECAFVPALVRSPTRLLAPPRHPRTLRAAGARLT